MEHCEAFYMMVIFLLKGEISFEWTNICRGCQWTQNPFSNKVRITSQWFINALMLKMMKMTTKWWYWWWWKCTAIQQWSTAILHPESVQPAKSLDNLRTSDDPIQDTSDYKYQYRHLDRTYYTQKVSKIRPHSSMNRLDNRSVGCPQLWCLALPSSE